MGDDVPLPISPKKRALMPSSRLRRALRAAGHHLHPIVQVGKEGVSEAVLRQLDQALIDHELVKVKIGTETPEDRFEAAEALGTGTSALVAQVLGRTMLVYRRHPVKPRFETPPPGALPAAFATGARRGADRVPPPPARAAVRKARPRPVGRPAGRPGERSEQRIGGRTGERTAGRAGPTGGRVGARPGARTGEWTRGRTGARPAARTGEWTRGRTGARPAAQAREWTVERPGGRAERTGGRAAGWTGRPRVGPRAGRTTGAPGGPRTTGPGPRGPRPTGGRRPPRRGGRS